MANSINLEELRAQRAVRSVKASEQAVDNFIETGEIQAQEVIDPRQQSFFKESQKPRETSAICGEDLNIEDCSDKSSTGEPDSERTHLERYIKEETQPETEEEEDFDKENLSEKDWYDSILKQKRSTRRRDAKTSKTYSISLPCALIELVDKMSENRFMTRSSLLYLLIMKGIGIELGANVKKMSLPRPVES